MIWKSLNFHFVVIESFFRCLKHLLSKFPSRGLTASVLKLDKRKGCLSPLALRSHLHKLNSMYWRQLGEGGQKFWHVFLDQKHVLSGSKSVFFWNLSCFCDPIIFFLRVGRIWRLCQSGVPKKRNFFFFLNTVKNSALFFTFFFLRSFTFYIKISTH